MSNIINVIGKVYGRLTVVSFSHVARESSYWNCICSCGGSKMAVRKNKLTGGTVRSCGCLQIEKTVERCRTHGESRNTKEYRSWRGAKERCGNCNLKEYPRYGGRGIKVCDRWINSYENFLSDMGRAPSVKHSIDRINNNGDYEPGNCRWATYSEQNFNRRKWKRKSQS